MLLLWHFLKLLYHHSCYSFCFDSFSSMLLFCLLLVTVFEFEVNINIKIYRYTEKEKYERKLIIPFTNRLWCQRIEIAHREKEPLVHSLRNRSQRHKNMKWKTAKESQKSERCCSFFRRSPFMFYSYARLAEPLMKKYKKKELS